MKRRPPPDMPSLIPSPPSVTDCTRTSKLIAADDPRRVDANDGWSLFEAKPTFRAWACDPFTHTNGARYRYAVVSRDPFPGLGWVCLVYVNPLAGTLPQVCDESAGAFYDGADDHPEGAIEWAKSGALAKKAHWFDGEEWVDHPWMEALIGLGESRADARVKAIRKPLAPSVVSLVGKLAEVRVLWRQPDTLALWGIPYDMREGQSPNDLARAHRNWEAPRYPKIGGSKRIDLSDWVWIGQPGWWGSWSKADIAAITAWLALPRVAENIPGGPCEWATLPKRPLPEGYPTPASPFRTRDVQREEFVALGYTESESWTLYYQQRKRVVEDPLAPYADIIHGKTLDAWNKTGPVPLTPREQAWHEDHLALWADPALRLLIQIEDEAGTPPEETHRRLALGEVGMAALRRAGRRS